MLLSYLTLYISTFITDLLAPGPLLQKILHDMFDKVWPKKAVTPNMFVYSAHDVTIAGNMQAVGFYNNIEPPYASAIIYELHELEAKKYFVKVRSLHTGNAMLCMLHHFM